MIEQEHYIHHKIKWFDFGFFEKNQNQTEILYFKRQKTGYKSFFSFQFIKNKN